LAAAIFEKSVFFQIDDVALIIDISQGALAVNRLWLECLQGSTCRSAKKRIKMLTQVKGNENLKW